ncbi:MAG: sulfatase-like hydrolase/transferase [Flavobacteriaceae bacterium]|nr:sulfatase-like hydrolase/transferase [Flavobacteriaceae bacterium]
MTIRKLVVLFFLIFSSCSKTNLNKPNILLIVSDDQGYYDVSYYGTKDIKTPNIDKICENGIRFDNFYANSPVCSPTRASLMTGLYPDFAGVPGVIRTFSNNNWGYLSQKAKLLPDQLNKLNYNTALIGKWHLGLKSPNTPNERGFKFFKGWLGDMMDDYWKHLRHGINYMRLNDQIIKPIGHATDLFTDWAIEYIKSNRDSETPFFLYLAYNAPHFPVQPPKSNLDIVKNREIGIDSIRANLVAFIEHMDDGIGKVIQELKDSGKYDNTVIIFTSDNGGHLPSKANNGPLRDGKQSVYEGGLKVPTVISWKDKLNKKGISNMMLSTMDLYPTILEIAGSKKDYKIDGISFYSELINPKNNHKNNRTIYFTRREGGTRYGGQSIYALRKGDWKLLQNSPYDSYELYNLLNDPLEKNNLINNEVEKYKELNSLLMKHIQIGGKVPWQDYK